MGFVPPAGKALLFIGQDVGSIRAYVDATQNIPAGWMAYTSIQALHGLEHPIDYGAGIQHAQVLIKQFPNTALQIGFWMVGALKEITDGDFDASIDRFGAWLRKAACPIYLRVGYEFDLPENGYEPEAYVRAYRYVVGRLRKSAAENIAYVWHSYASTLDKPLESWYPGDGYVDWCAVSFFDQREDQLVPMAEFSKRHHKPLMIAEATPRGIGTGNAALWAQWWNRVAGYIHEYKVQGLSYINTDWESLPMFKGQGWGDSRIEVNAEVSKLWFEEVGKPAYVQAKWGAN